MFVEFVVFKCFKIFINFVKCILLYIIDIEVSQQPKTFLKIKKKTKGKKTFLHLLQLFIQIQFFKELDFV